MWGKNAICVSCGAYKRQPQLRCRACGREPSSDYEIARALILSIDPGNRKTAVGRSAADLQRIGADIRSGRPYLFDPSEEQKALRVGEELKELEQKKRLRNHIIRVSIILLIFVIAYFLWPSAK